MQLTVAIIGRAQGLKGEVKAEIRTDDPKGRLAVGKSVQTASGKTLQIASMREYKGSYYLRFTECDTRECAEALRGTELVIESDLEDAEEDAWFRHELIGLEALDPEGYELGEVIGVETLPGHDLLVIREPEGEITRVPFVREIVTAVDIEDHCVVIDAPAGLFSYDEE